MANEDKYSDMQGAIDDMIVLLEANPRVAKNYYIEVEKIVEVPKIVEVEKIVFEEKIIERVIEIPQIIEVEKIVVAKELVEVLVEVEKVVLVDRHGPAAGPSTGPRPEPQFKAGQSVHQWWASWMPGAAEPPSSLKKGGRPAWYSSSVTSGQQVCLPSHREAGSSEHPASRCVCWQTCYQVMSPPEGTTISYGGTTLTTWGYKVY